MVLVYYMLQIRVAVNVVNGSTYNSRIEELTQAGGDTIQRPTAELSYVRLSNCASAPQVTIAPLGRPPE